MFKTVEITEELKKRAIIHAKDRMNYEYNRFNQSNTFRLDMILIGTLGELTFETYLKSKEINYEMEFQAGEYDSMDFKINNKIIEIKTSGYSGSFERLNLLYNSNQYNQSINKGFNYVVQIFVNGFDRRNQKLILDKCNKAIIVGYIEHSKIVNFPPVGNTYYSNHRVPLHHLNNIDLILK